MVAAGALRMNPLDGIPDEVTGGRRDGDERFETCHRPPPGRRVGHRRSSPPQRPGLTIRRGVAVVGLLTTTGADGIVHVTGCAPKRRGRRPPTSSSTPAAGVGDGRRGCATPARPGPKEMIEDCGFVYYGRHFRSADGSVPPAFGGLLQPYGSVSILTLPADNGTWGVGVITSSKDAALRGLKEVDRWEKVVAVVPAGRSLDRWRADHRRQADGQDRGSPTHVRRRRRAGRHRRRAVGRRVGVHQPVARARHLDRHGPRRGTAARCCARGRSTTRGLRRCAGTS